MSFARQCIAALGLATIALMPVVAQEHATTEGRAIATLAQVALKSRNGTAITLGSRVGPGKPTLIAIWTSWCMPCVAEAPYLSKTRKDLGDGYNFLYINRREGDPDPDQPPEAITQFLARASMSNIDYVTADVRAFRQILGSDITDIPQGMVGIPRIYLFDRQGRQIYTAYGFGDADSRDLERRIKQAMVQ